jgi:hypothetical protein
MADQNERDRRNLYDVIRDLDDLCRDAERVRARVEESMRQKAFWPERRKQPRINSSDTTREQNHSA